MTLKSKLREALLSITVAVASASPVVAAGDTSLWLPGVNLSGAEFNGGSTRIYWDYTYPTKSEIDYYTKKGMKVFRVPVLTSRILSQSLSNNGGGQDWQALTGFITQAAAAGASVIIDIHQYGTMPSGLVGRNPAATTEFVAAWSEIAKRVKAMPNVIFGLMNEPNQQSASEWIQGANAAIAAIRTAGATQLILVPGSYWDGAHSWTSTDNANVMVGVKDPANNFAYEVHQYLDQWSSGTTAAVAKGTGKTSLVAFTAWARAHNAKGFLGEFGFASSPEAMSEGTDLLAYMAANKDVWRGWTYWAGGPWMGSYMFSVEPVNGVDKPQMAVVAKYAVPPAPVAPAVTSPVAPAVALPAVKAKVRGGSYTFEEVSDPVPVKGRNSL